jgi:hypothetical protein
MARFPCFALLLACAVCAVQLPAQAAGSSAPLQKNILSFSFQALGDFIAFYHNDAETVTPIGGTWMDEISGSFEYRFLDDFGAEVYGDYKDYSWAIGVRGPAIHAGLGLVYHIPGGASPESNLLAGVEWAGIWASSVDFLNGIGITSAVSAVWKFTPWLNGGIRAAIHMNAFPGIALHAGPNSDWANSEFFSISLGPVVTVAF